MELRPENKGVTAASFRKPLRKYSPGYRRNSRIRCGIRAAVLLFCFLCFLPGIRAESAEGRDGSWYLLDPTWDAGQENYRYCLRGTDVFRTGDGSGTGDPETGVPEADPSEENSRKTERSESGETGGTGLVLHVPGPVFQTEDFLRNHPMAAQGR